MGFRLLSVHGTSRLAECRAFASIARPATNGDGSKRRNRMIGRNVLAGAAMAAVVSLGVSVGAAAEPINLTIGALLELTGPLSESGPSQDKAINLAVDQANKAAA